MTTKAAFIIDHWNALVAAGPAIARAVSHAAGAAGQSTIELDAYSRYVADTTVEQSRATLVGELAWDVNGYLASGGGTSDDDPFAQGLEAARRAGAILGVVASPDDAREIREWLLEGARRVAQAAREGGVLGIGGEQVSEWERETMATMREALGGETLR